MIAEVIQTVECITDHHINSFYFNEAKLVFDLFLAEILCQFLVASCINIFHTNFFELFGKRYISTKYNIIILSVFVYNCYGVNPK